MVNQYDTAFYEQGTTGAKRSAQVVLPIAIERSGKPNSLVDAGCGTGSLLAAASEPGIEGTRALDGAYADRSELKICVNSSWRQIC